jgi:hypothetical protein
MKILILLLFTFISCGKHITPIAEDLNDDDGDQILNQYETGFEKYVATVKDKFLVSGTMKFNSGNAYDCFEQIGKIINSQRGDKFVEDEISYFENSDLFNFSPFNDFNFFIEKNDQLLSNIKLWFYGLNCQTNLMIKTNGVENHLWFKVINLWINIKFNKEFKVNPIDEKTSCEYVIMRGLSQRKKPHCCIYKNDNGILEPYFDPHPTAQFLSEEHYFYTIEDLSHN